MTEPFIIAIDLAGPSGVAEGRPGETPRLYSMGFAKPHDDHKVVFGRALGWLAEHIEDVLPDLVYIEAPMKPGAHRTNPETTIRLIGLWATLGAECSYRGIMCREAAATTVRVGFIGHGRIDMGRDDRGNKRKGGGDEAKERVFAMCKLLGWKPPNKDASDAGALWWYAVNKFRPSLAPIITPMMHRQVATRIDLDAAAAAEALFKKAAQ